MYAVRYVGYRQFLPCSGFLATLECCSVAVDAMSGGHVVRLPGCRAWNTGSGAVHCRWDHSQAHIPQYRPTNYKRAFVTTNQRNEVWSAFLETGSSDCKHCSSLEPEGQDPGHSEHRRNKLRRHGLID